MMKKSVKHTPDKTRGEYGHVRITMIYQLIFALYAHMRNVDLNGKARDVSRGTE